MQNMFGLDIVQILNVGIIGLAFLLAFLVYRLVAKGQRGPGIAIFVWFSITMVVVGMASQTMQKPPEMLIKWSCHRAIGNELSDLRKSLDKMESDQHQYLADLDTRLVASKEKRRDLVDAGKHVEVDAEDGYARELERLSTTRRAELMVEIKKFADTINELERRCT